MFQFIPKILEAIFDELEYRLAKRSVRHAGLNRKRDLQSKYLSKW
jgi:hypothetical protein